MDTVLRRFAARLHNLRMERGITQNVLAARAKLHPTFVSALERGIKTPTLTTIEMLAKGLDCDISTLVDFPSASGATKDRVREEIELIVRRLQRCDLLTVRRIRKAVENLTAT